MSILRPISKCSVVKFIVNKLLVLTCLDKRPISASGA
jgi:hypothetical protein